MTYVRNFYILILNILHTYIRSSAFIKSLVLLVVKRKKNPLIIYLSSLFFFFSFCILINVTLLVGDYVCFDVKQ